MVPNILIALINNATLLVVLVIIYEVVYTLPSKQSSMQPIFSGLMIALICAIIMNIPFTLQYGIIFDTRTILISVTALMFGLIPTAITVTVAVIVRWSIGGVGMLPGLATILTSALIGLAWRRWLYPKSTKWSWLNVFAMSASVHVAMLFCMFLLPYPDSLNVIKAIMVPVLLIYPITTVLLSLLLMRQQALRQIQDQLKQSAEESKVLFEKLLESEKKYRDIAENVSDVVWQTDLNLNTTYVSPSIEHLFGEAPEEYIKRTLEERFSKQTQNKLRALLVNEIGKKEEENPKNIEKHSRRLEVEHYKADGTAIWIELDFSVIRDIHGNATGFLGISRDISQRKLAERALKESERSKSVLLSNLPGMAYRCNYDREWTMQFVSAGCFNLTGYTPENFINNKDLSFNDIITSEYRDPLWQEWESILPKRAPFKYEYEIITASGKRKWVLEMGQGIYDEGKIEALEGIVLDISEKKETESNLIYMTEHDGLTGLYNRDYLEMLLEKDAYKNDGAQRAIIGINLSTVQLLTAKYGFSYTQNLIKKAAGILSQYCTNERMLFQTYENRFVFYLKNYKDKNELIGFSEIIASAMESVFAADKMSGGIGVLEIEQGDNIEIDRLLRRLLIASESVIDIFGKNFVVCFYDEVLEAAANREMEITQELTQIAEADAGNELFLQYQPIMDLKTNCIYGFEALARLRSKKLGLVSPVEFIPIAEKTKLINPLGEKIIRKAFSFLNTLKEHGYKSIGVSINVSAIQLLRPDFTDRFFELIDEMQANPMNISIEITESVFAFDYENINNIIKRLVSVGISVDIDDFGTGYSSLARVKELGVNCLKIDKSFIDRLPDTDPNKAITGDIISIAHKLGHSTIAEGVEVESQLLYLKDKGCDKVQGYLISKPLDAEIALAFLANRENNRDRL